MAMSATLDSRKLTNSMNAMDVLFKKAEFNEKAKFGLLRTTVMRVSELCSSTMYHSLSSYE